ncbi:MAG: hypothetical protein QOH64_2767, partial [Acidimicrobiaceae bacterium]
MSSNRFRRIKRLGAALTAGALGVGFLPIAALTGTASASAPTPTVQSTTAWCANASTTNPFTDLPSSNVHFANVLCLAAAGITHGTTATTYSPSNPVRRDQMASFIAQFLDLAKSLETTAGSLTALPASGPDAFTDDNGDTHEANINRLAAAGIVNGTGGGTYSPADPVRRDQMASFINNAIEFLTGTRYSSTTDFFDDDNGDVHEANINGLAGAGIVSGTGGGLYSPANPVLRDSMGSFIIRTAAKLNADGKIKILPPAPGASNQSYAVNPGFGGVKTVSTTTGANTQRGAITCSVTTTDTVSLGLVPFLNTTVVSGKTVFKDANQDLRADNMGNPSGSGLPGAFIQSVNGVAQPANTAFIPNVVAGSDGKITFILNSVTNNSTASAVVFKDADTNGQLNLTSTDPNTFFGLPSEAFGSGCSGVWIPPEAGLATFNLDLTDPSCPINPGAGTAPGVVIAIQILHEFTSCSLQFNYGSDDVYQYASNVGGPNITITEA